jgi:perosamine synthetase
MDQQAFYHSFAALTQFKPNRFHPLVWINGDPKIGENVYIGGMSEVNAKGACVVIGDNCDIASFVAINCADSHKRCIGFTHTAVCKDIIIEHNVFIGSHSVVKGGAHIGHHSVVAAGTIVDGVTIPPFSLVFGNPMQVKSGYYASDKTSYVVPHNKPSLGKEEIFAATRVLKSGWVAQGYEVEAFENEVCDFLGLPHGHAVAVSSGTAALFLALRTVNAQGCQVALPVYVCSALRHAIALARAHEVLIDCASNSPNIDIEQVKASNAQFAIIPHMFGLPIDLSVLKGVTVIEDCAQALGAKVHGVAVGLQGACGVFSFYATKLITTGGQGGAFVAKDKGLVDSVRDYREFDQRNDYNARFNFQLTDLQAAIGREQLKKLPFFLKRREEIFLRYKNANIPLLDGATQGAGLTPVHYRAVIHSPYVKELSNRLLVRGVKTIVPIHDWELLGQAKEYPHACSLTHNTLSLPLYPELSDENVEKIIKGVLG